MRNSNKRQRQPADRCAAAWFELQYPYRSLFIRLSGPRLQLPVFQKLCLYRPPGVAAACHRLCVVLQKCAVLQKRAVLRCRTVHRWGGDPCGPMCRCAVHTHAWGAAAHHYLIEGLPTCQGRCFMDRYHCFLEPWKGCLRFHIPRTARVRAVPFACMMLATALCEPGAWLACRTSPACDCLEGPPSPGRVYLAPLDNPGGLEGQVLCGRWWALCASRLQVGAATPRRRYGLCTFR